METKEKSEFIDLFKNFEALQIMHLTAIAFLMVDVRFGFVFQKQTGICELVKKIYDFFEECMDKDTLISSVLVVWTFITVAVFLRA